MEDRLLDENDVIDFFVGYTDKDKAAALSLIAEIRARGYATWPPAGRADDLVDDVSRYQEAIIRTRATVLLISRQSLDSGEITRLIQPAISAGKRIIPVLLDISLSDLSCKCPELYAAIGSLSAIDLAQLVPVATASAIIGRLEEFNPLRREGRHVRRLSDQPAPTKYGMMMVIALFVMGLVVTVIAVLLLNHGSQISSKRTISPPVNPASGMPKQSRNLPITPRPVDRPTGLRRRCPSPINTTPTHPLPLPYSDQKPCQPPASPSEIASPEITPAKEIYAADFNGWSAVFGRIAKSQWFTVPVDGTITQIKVRAARLNASAPAASLQIEVRDPTLTSFYVAGIIDPGESDLRFRWLTVIMSHSARLPAGRYLLLFHSAGSDNLAPWIVNTIYHDIYPPGWQVGFCDQDIFFDLTYDNGHRLIVGPEGEGDAIVPINSGGNGGYPCPGPLQIYGCCGKKGDPLGLVPAAIPIQPDNSEAHLGHVK